MTVNECDHTIGIYYEYDNTDLVTVSTLLDKDFSMCSYYEYKKENLASKVRWIEGKEYTFKYCPYCRRKIQWDEIREQLKTTL